MSKIKKEGPNEFYIYTTLDIIGPFTSRILAEQAMFSYDKWQEEDSRTELRRFKDDFE